jgi:hypothetical protein
LQNLRTNIAQFQQAVSAIPQTPDGYPITWSAAERPPNLLERPPATERDQAFVLAQAFRRENQQEGYRGTGMDQVTTHGNYFATAQFDNGNFEVYRTEDYLAFLQTDPQGNVSLLRPLTEVEGYVAEKVQPQLLAATQPPQIEPPSGFERS